MSSDLGTEVSCARAFTPLYGLKQKKYNHRGLHQLKAIVVHTTGSGPHSKAKVWSMDPFDAALRMYSEGFVGDFGGHFVVGQRAGQIVQMCPMTKSAWHVGSSRRHLYLEGGWDEKENMDWWSERWPDFNSPADLAGGMLWSTGRPNDVTVGIEVVPQKNLRADWSKEGWGNLIKLCKEISENVGLRLTRETVITHSDAAPISRTTPSGRQWDPGPEKWKGWESFARRAGLPLTCG